ncbi:selenocysteine-specific translation elongation factor [Siminovitchia sediminis]|uniref:Selenocysteine-specific elongation factor n=1 Tax=Siminovitchia sediminis TaxID=1274353 RepID=A0ABW4KH25_9BACI
MSQYFTIGMAGHIDHGKTTLTKALTGIDTDRLKEEQERSISIELGYAPFIKDDQMQVSIVDVPGHERFIRQMIAGVAGIDMAVLVIAADEGIMPQTKEHLDILSLLGINHGLVAVTKIDKTDREMLELVLEDINENLKQTFLNHAPVVCIDSLSDKGIPQLKSKIIEELRNIKKKEIKGSFRLPIDQVFTVKGQGTVVRGTVYDGEVKQGERLRVLPKNKEVRVRQIQIHHQQSEKAFSGQRTAINIGGLSYEDVSRGDVLVADEYYSVTDRIDVVFFPLNDLKYQIKQRQPVKFYIGTSEVMGKMIFFDRNEISENFSEEILCQIQLEKKVVASRGDRFIIRKPTPVETVGGGWVIDPKGRKYRFGDKTIDQLKMKKEGRPIDRIRSLLKENLVLKDSEIVKKASITEEEFHDMSGILLKMNDGFFALHSTIEQLKHQITHLSRSFHQQFPMRLGLDKAEMTSELKRQYPVILIEQALRELIKEKRVKIDHQYVSLADRQPELPHAWKTRLENVQKVLIEQGIQVDKFSVLLNRFDIPADIQKEFYHYLIHMNKAFVLDEDMLISRESVEQAYLKLKKDTDSQDFTLQIARQSLQVTRKYLVPLLELFDTLGYTKRADHIRKWVDKSEMVK